MLAGMVFDPHIGMTPNDWRETEVRREESRQRVHNPHGREASRGARMIAGTILGVAFLALIIYAVLGWAGVIPIPGLNV
jgi:hypothetical protein